MKNDLSEWRKDVDDEFARVKGTDEQPNIGEDFVQLLEYAEELKTENDLLRGIAAKVFPCHYCGMADISQCPKGFPGCSLADDIFCAEEEYVRILSKENAALKVQIQNKELAIKAMDIWAKAMQEKTRVIPPWTLKE